MIHRRLAWALHKDDKQSNKVFEREAGEKMPTNKFRNKRRGLTSAIKDIKKNHEQSYTKKLDNLEKVDGNI